MIERIRNGRDVTDDEKEYMRSLEEITLSDTEIKSYGYDDCTNVRKVIIGSQVRHINYDALKNCHKIAEVEIHPDNDFFVSEGNCVVTKRDRHLVLCFGEQRMPDTIRTAALDSFVSEGEIEDFYIGESLEKLVSRERCFHFNNIVLSPGNTHFILEGNCLFEKGSDEIILGCRNSELPERSSAIHFEAFYNVNIQKLSLPAGIKTIRNAAFENCTELKDIVFRDGLREIGDYAFSGCHRLERIDLPPSLTSAGVCAFSYCEALKTSGSLGGIHKIADRMFYSSGLESVTIPGHIKSVGKYAFGQCKKMTAAVVSDGTEEIGSDAFSWCESLKTVTMTDTVKTLGESSFAGCRSLTRIRLSEAIKTIPSQCFFKCKSLTEITLPAGLEHIEYWAFYFCSKLERVNLSELKKLKKYPKDAFSGCGKFADRPITKPQKLPAKLYTEKSFGQLVQEYKKGDKLVLDTLTSKVMVIFDSAFTHKGSNYLYVHKKTLNYFLEIAGEKETHEIYVDMEVYACKPIGTESAKFQELAAALSSLKM